MIEKTTIDLSEERRLIIQMIISTPLLTSLKGIAKPQLFESSLSKTIAIWIWEFFDYTGQAPGKSIQDIYLKKQSEINDDDQKELIADFLRNLSSDWENNTVNNVPYITANAIEFLKLRSLSVLKNELDRMVQAKDFSQGELLVKDYKRVEKLTSSGVDILTDTKAIISAFNFEEEKLFKFPGDLGEAVGDINRGDFVGIMGAPKKGKTHYLYFSSYRALLSGLKTLFISLEMTEQEMLRIMWTGIMGQPIQTKTIPVAMFEEGKDGKEEVVIQKLSKPGLDLTEVEQKQAMYRKQLKGGGLKLLTFPSKGVTFEQIKTEITNLEYYDNWIPDVLVIDYADLLEPSRKLEYRHGLDDVWRALRGYAQEKYIAVITASQAGRKGLERDIKSGDVSEDVRKMAHVTKMLLLNQNEKEEDAGLIRIRTGVQRHGKKSNQSVVISQCYDIGRPYMDSRFKEKLNYNQYEEKEESAKKK